MNEKRLKKRLDFSNSMISRQHEQIENLKSQIEKLKLELKEKDEIINSVTPLKNELAQNVAEIKGYKEEYGKLIEELRKMKKIMNQTVCKNRWWLIKRFIK